METLFLAFLPTSAFMLAGHPDIPFESLTNKVTMLQISMDAIRSSILDSPVKIYAASLTTIFVGYLVIYGFRRVVLSNKSTLSYPPGPPIDPLIGAMRSFPKEFPLARFNEWAAAYGMFCRCTEERN
jgi:hypothetical protein